MDLTGGPMLYGAWKRAWLRALKVTGSQMDNHQLRNFFASALISGGASVNQVQEALGHASAVITLGVYAHFSRATKTAPGHH